MISDLDFLSYTQSAVQAAGLLTSFRSRSIGVTFLAPTNQVLLAFPFLISQWYDENQHKLLELLLKDTFFF